METQTHKPTHDGWGKPIWYPEDKPYRVLSHVRSSNPLHYGWRTGVCETFATEQEARDFAATVTGAFEVMIHRAETKPGKRGFRWHQVACWKKAPRCW